MGVPTPTLKVCKKTPISIKWKEDLSKANQGLGEAKNGVEEGRDLIKNQNESVSVENNNSTVGSRFSTVRFTILVLLEPAFLTLGASLSQLKCPFSI